MYLQDVETVELSTIDNLPTSLTQNHLTNLSSSTIGKPITPFSQNAGVAVQPLPRENQSGRSQSPMQKF